MEKNLNMSILKKTILICLGLIFVFVFPYSTTSSYSGNYKVYLPLVIQAPDPCNSGACYYVDSLNGSDSNSGTSVNKPWKNLSKLASTSLQPGTTVRLKRNSVWQARLNLNSSGQAGKPITITAYGSGNAPILSNPGDTSNDEPILSLFGSYYVIDGLNIQDSGTGINIWSNHNIVQNSEISNTAAGIDIHGQYNQISDNYIHDTRMVVNTNNGGSDDWGANGITIDNSHNEISYNQFVNCEAFSYDFGKGGGALEIWQNGDYTSIHHNRSFNTDGFIELSSDGHGSAVNVSIFYNLVINSTRFTYIHLDATNGIYVKNFRAENNTLVDLRHHDPRIGNFIGFDGNPSSDTYYLINNIIYITDYYNMSSYPGFTHYNNLYYLVNTNLGLPMGAGEAMANPQFVHLDQYDFHFMATSPAIDKGVNLGHPLDFEGNAVPEGKSPDLGAFEYQGK